ncbi:ABC transporter permease [Ruminiclostridium cellobioparum]|uniref:ABC transporter permease n=1 Tax=Ruminiclostridium cellobioparum TaxID=29355 RepID=UPI0028AB9980|nr:ABC transporter permease [Ruminiclostridium cellobioparum]
MKKIKVILLSLIIPVTVIIVWSIATARGVAPEAILPSIKSVLNAFRENLASGQLAQDLGISLSRVVKGYFAAVLLGVTLGTVMGMSNNVNHIFSLTLNAIRQIPMMAWIPLIILWFGIDELSKIVVIILGAFFPIMVNTFSGIRGTPPGYIEVARLYKLSRWNTFKKVYLPSAIPQIFVGLKLGLGISWMAVVAAELIASTEGIGFRISDARSMMKPDIVIMGMVVIGLVGIVMDKLLTFVSKKSTPWIGNKG